MTQLEGGGGNLVLLLQADGRKLVLRRYERIPPSEAEFELRLTRFLTERGFPTQPLLVRIDGSLSSPLPDRPAALFEFVEGEEPVPGSGPWRIALRRPLRACTVLTRDLELPGARAWTDLAALNRLEEFARSDGDQVRDPLWPELLDDCRELRAALDERVFPRDSELPKGIIHHDLHPGNLLLDRQGEVVLLDFDEAQVGWLVLDLASLIRYWGMDGEWEHVDPAKSSKLLGIYDRHRALLDVERELLPEMLRLFFMGDALWFILPALARDPSSLAVTSATPIADSRDLKVTLIER